MKRVSMLYSDQAQFVSQLERNQVDLHGACLVRIYTATLAKEQALLLIEEIKSVLPCAQILGGTGSGVIFNGTQYEEDTLVIVEQFADTIVSVGTGLCGDLSPEQTARSIVDAISDKAVSLMHILFDQQYAGISHFVDAFNEYAPGVKLAGGNVGDVLSATPPIPAYIFTQDGIVTGGVIYATLSNPDLHTFVKPNIAHEAISSIYTLNKADGVYLNEIESASALNWCREQFGMQDFAAYTDWEVIAENDDLLRFPIILEGHGGASRFLKFDPATQKMSLYFSHIHSNTQFRIGYTSPTRCVHECFKICTDMNTTPIESLFCYTCLFRKMYFGNCANWELRPFLNYGVCGVFMMGEICYLNNKNEYLNGSCCFVGIAEHDTALSPDYSVFEDLYNIKDGDQLLLQYVLQKQSAKMTRENQALLEQLLDQQRQAKEQLYIDSNTGTYNTIKFSQDNLIHKFDKMCLVQIENADLLQTRFGQDWYFNLMRKAVERIRNYAKTIKQRNHLHYYILNESTLFMAAGATISETDFIQVVRSFYEEFQFMNFDGKDEMFVNRFIVVLNQKNILEKALSTLQSCKHLQTHFIIADDMTEHHENLGTEMDMLRILKSAIADKRIIPYFQGIYDNSLKCITKYEALMRIQDEAGTIYAPAAFMDIAKKYHLYVDLSSIMVQKVIDLAPKFNHNISINLSVYDVNYDQMQEFILRQLSRLGKNCNIVLEILEDEDFRDMNVLREFISKVRKFGVKIAIDDFGRGYSNFVEIAKIEPDYIKIDGSIIRSINSDEVSKKVLRNIVFLGQQLDAELIAEFVSDEKIQNAVQNAGIHFSQGYYYAKPMPFEELPFNKP